MIYKFSAKNFYSFKETVETSFEVNANAPHTDIYVKDLHGNRVSKVLSVIGANASGKTNLLKILTFTQFLIRDSYNDLKPDEKFPFASYKFTPDENVLTELSVRFNCDDMVFDYFIKLNRQQILEERLRKLNNHTKQFGVLYKRTWSIKEDKYHYSLRNFNFSEKLTTKRTNATLLAIAGQAEHTLSKKIINCWDKFIANVDQIGREDYSGSIFEAAGFYEKNTEIHNKADSLLKKFDLGLSGTKSTKYTHKSKSGKEEEMYLPYGIHSVKDKNYDLPLLYESRGTQNLFILLHKILPILKSGGIAVFDEFDADLHPLMLPELVDMFASKTSNPKNAQLIFSTHHLEILNRLDKYQIVLVEKNAEKHATEVFRLDEIRGVRADDNYYSKYIAGAYGAIPEI